MLGARQLLTILIGAAVGAGGWMYGCSGLREKGSTARSSGMNQELERTREELQILRDENESLRSLAQGGGEVSVPQELIHAVEKDYGLEFISNPVVHRVAAEELGFRVEAALESRLGSHGMIDRQDAFQRIGWLGEGDELLTQLVAVGSVGVDGWFDEQLGEAWVTHRFDLKNVPDQATMLRLLVRILLNQHFPAAVAYPGDDAARAREALHAGAAAGAESRFYAQSARSIGFLRPEENGPSERLMLSLPKFVRGVSEFPENAGAPLTDTLFVKGKDSFAELFRDPPLTTHAIAFPKNARRSADIGFAEVDGEVFLKENGGYLGVKIWLEEVEDGAVAEEIASSWAGDGYLLFADGESSTGVVWDIEFQDANAADRFAEAARKRMIAMQQKAEERILGVSRVSQERVRFLNVATQEMFSRLTEE